MVNYRSVLSNESALSDTDFVHATSPITSNEALRLLGNLISTGVSPENYRRQTRQLTRSTTSALDSRRLERERVRQERQQVVDCS